MPYIMSITNAGRTVEISKYYTLRYKSKGATRKGWINPTTEKQEEINTRHAATKLRLRINANFGEGDYHMVTDYTRYNKPASKEEMRKDADECLKLMRKEYKKLGKELKYIHVMEIGTKGARHHHWVINNIDPKILQKCWKKGRIHLDPLDDSGQYRDLANYLIKQTSKCKELQSKRWNSSRNLIIPEPTKIVINEREWFRSEAVIPKEYRDYYIEKNSVQKGISDETGLGYFRYTLIKIKERCG